MGLFVVKFSSIEYWVCEVIDSGLVYKFLNIFGGAFGDKDFYEFDYRVFVNGCQYAVVLHVAYDSSKW